MMEVLGFMFIFGIGAAGMVLVRGALSDPAVMGAISDFSPWLANNSEVLVCVAFIAIYLAVAIVPYKLKMQEAAGGNNFLAPLGYGFLTVILIVSFGYLAGIGWFATVS